VVGKFSAAGSVSSTSCLTDCGDGILQGAEACDNGNTSAIIVGLSVDQDFSGLALSWTIPRTSSPISMVQISISVLFPDDDYPWSQPDDYYQWTQFDEICTTMAHFLDCQFDVPLLSLPAGPNNASYLVTLRLTSFENTKNQYVDYQYVDVIGVPSKVEGVSIALQTQTAWSLRWTPPEYFFTDLNPLHNRYFLDLACNNDLLQVEYFNTATLVQGTFKALLDVEWHESGWNGVGSPSVVNISATKLGVMYTDALMCEKGSNISITVLAGNKFFVGDASHPVLLTAISVPSSPTIDNVVEIPNGGGLNVTWFQVRNSVMCAYIFP